MANTISMNKLLEGPRHLVVQFTFLIDTTAEFSSTLVDPNGSGTCDPSPKLGAVATFTVEEIWWNGAGIDAYLTFDASTPQQIFVLPHTAGDTKIDFREWGGIKDKSGTGATGKIKVTTIGATANTTGGTLILKLRKD